MPSINFSKKSIIFITGASRGIGRTIAIELSRRLEQNSILILLARSEKGLEETKAQIGEVDKGITVQHYVTDFSKPNIDDYTKLIQKVLESVDTKGIELGMLFHNAGYVGTVKQTTDLTDITAWREYYDVNLFSVAMLNSIFIKKIRPVAPQLVVVNITSLVGRTPFANLAMYGSGKAARDIFFKVLATEEPNVVVFNYSPGPVDTDMFEYIVENAQSTEVQKSFKETRESSILTTAQTVNKMLELLEKGDFKSGDTIDYFDS
ncbi:sepiapterin reductase [Leptinotarsa decemlineata]|uniref:sepiapterin reductase n=1 Tax=Leptinotarsa decemlineata TaxID=7539 RepID=UPI003D309A4E